MSTPITTATELQAMTVAGDYILSNNIDASETSTWNGGLGFAPIGTTGAGFTGSFDGKGYTITSLTINRTTSYVGLFGTIGTGGTVVNVTLASPSIVGDGYVGGIIGSLETNSGTFSNLHITGGTIQGGDDYVGGIVGFIIGGTPTFSACSSSASVTSTGNDSIGGFVGCLYPNSSTTTFNQCYVTGTVSGSLVYSLYVGGFAGYVREAHSTFYQCYTTGAISGYNCIGGFVGESDIDANDSEINYSQCYTSGSVTGNYCIGGFGGELQGTCTNCYARGAVTGGTSGYIGGFAGWSDVLVNVYSTGLITGSGTPVGGLTGQSYVSITSSYWDTTTSGKSTSGGGTGKTTAQMKVQLTYSGWDFTTIWMMDSITNDGYPYFGTGRCFCIPDLFDWKGRVAKGARVRAYRDDTHELIKEGLIDQYGNATICGLPNDTDISFHVTWGGSSSSGEERWFYSDIPSVAEGGTGSSLAPTARTNLGLAIGTNVQAWNNNLDDIAALTPTDSNIIVGNGTDWVAESGDTARISLGVGTTDSPQLAGVNVGDASDTTLARDAAGIVSIEGKRITRSAAYIIAANDSEIKTQADYVCDGTNDHLDIQAAIDALPATGGEVLLLDGTYNIEVSLVLDSYQTLRGCGRSTILTTTTANLDIITATGGSGTEKTGILIADLCIDGNAGGVTNDIGIYWEYVDNSKILNCWLLDNGEHGINLVYSDKNTLLGNTCSDNAWEGIRLDDSNGNSIVSNPCDGNDWNIGLVNSINNSITSNICQDGEIGIYLELSAYNSITANTCIGNSESGIVLTNACNVGTIANNICQRSGEYGISVASSDNVLVSHNTCTENSQTTTNTTDDIYVTGGSYCSIQANTCRAGALTKKPRFGINIGLNCTKILVSNNDLYNDGFVTGVFTDDGTLTTVRGNNRGIQITDVREYSYVKNTSGGALVAGDIVVLKAVAAGNEITTTTTEGDPKVYGMVAETIANTAYGLVQVLGKTTALKVDGTTDIAVGDFIGTFTTVKIGMKAASGKMAFAIALEAYATDDSSGVIDALIISPRLAGAGAGTGDFKADGSVPLTGDIDFAGTQQCHDLQAPVAAGEAIRQTAKITEAILEGLNDNALVHADVDDTPVNGETTVPISSNWAYDLITNLFTPIAGEILRQSVTSKCPSPFSALINGVPNATTVVYDTDTNEASVAGLYSGAGYWGRIMLYNSAKGTYRKIVSVEISTNTITTESSIDTWANDDAITTQSQTNTEAGYFDVDLSTNISASATVLNVSTLYRDLDKSAYDSERSLRVHSYSAFNDGKKFTTCASVIGEQSTLCFFVPVISQKITVQYQGTSNTMLIILMVKGYY